MSNHWLDLKDQIVQAHQEDELDQLTITSEALSALTSVRLLEMATEEFLLLRAVRGWEIA